MHSANSRRGALGLTLLVGPFAFSSLLFHSLPLAAQNYIDVEAERRAAQAGGGSAPGAVSYGVGTAPAVPATRTLPPPAAQTPAPDNVGGLFNQVQQLQQEVMRLNGVVEQQAYELQQLKEQSLERYLDLDRRLASGTTTSAAPGVAASGGAAAAASGAPSLPAAATGAEARERPGEGEAYRSAYALVRGQEFDRAVTAFQAFLRDFPDGRYAPNAHYWLGELYLVIDPADPEAARQAFTLLLNEYPQDAKVPDALYKLGRVQYIKGNPQRAREYLERVMREYPDSSAARLAGDFIDQNL
ncbi:MAG: tol-pal system protein YbgF [Halieaceae bacterium]|jgi:tol-pal system protein YbgF|nr:tol-pal system protein YbgF [Halieaceae bacterium]